MTALAIDEGAIIVLLTHEQETNAEAWGHLRVRRAAHSPDRFGDKSEERDTESIRAKVALGVLFHRDYDGSGRDERERGDVAPGIHARWTQPNGHLVIRDDDPPDHLYFLLIPGSDKTLRIVGYIRGRDARRDEWWKPDWTFPCWAVPQDALARIRPELFRSLIDLPP